MHFAHGFGLVACIGQQGGQGPPFGGGLPHDLLMGGIGDHTAGVAGLAGHQRGAGGHTKRAVCIAPGVGGTLGVQIIQVRGVDAGVAQRLNGVEPLLIGSDQQNIIFRQTGPSFLRRSVNAGTQKELALM